MRRVWASVVFLSLGLGCGSSSDRAPEGPGGGGTDVGPTDGGESDAGGCAPSEPRRVDCGAGECPPLDVVGDPFATTPGTFRGYSDPHLVWDPDAPSRLWLSYSWLTVGPLVDPSGNEVWVAIVTNHLARSDDGGRSFAFVQELWGSTATLDPEGSGEAGLIDSEVASLAWIRDPSGEVRWFGAHLNYFLRPVAGYHPDFSTSYTIRVGAAETPEGLSTAEEVVLGVTYTDPVWGASVALDQLVDQSVLDCGMVNNPTLLARGQTLYLAFECLAFDGTELVPERTTLQLVATEPVGRPSEWSWRHVGVLADAETYRQLGVEVLQQPDLSVDGEGRVLLAVTPSGPNPGRVERAHQGLRVLELASLDPPRLARDCDGRPRIRASIRTGGVGGCAHASGAATGALCHRVQTDEAPRALLRTGLTP